MQTADDIKAMGILNAMYDIPVVDKRWRDRPKSNIVKWMMENTNTSVEKVISYLGTTERYFNNKLHRDSFSIDDLILICAACDYDVAFISKRNYDTRKINPEVYFWKHNNEALERIKAYDENFLKKKELEYTELKIELNAMKEKYGFKD